MKKQSNKHNIITMIVVIVLLAVVVYSIVQIIDLFVPSKNTSTDSTSSTKTVTVKGEKYYPRKDITTFLLMGIDQKGPVQPSMSYNNEGEADMLALAVFDQRYND